MKLNRLYPVALIVVAAVLAMPSPAAAHCDTVDGPVVTAAKLALQKGDITPMLKWIPAKDEPELRRAFARTLDARKASPAAKEVADAWLFETLVRIHRAGEGEPFTGVKPAGTDPGAVIRFADASLESGEIAKLEEPLLNHIRKELQAKYATAVAAAKERDQSVEKGRAWVAAYVDYMHFAERLHKVLEGADHAH
jgi:hypothetical protein